MRYSRQQGKAKTDFKHVLDNREKGQIIIITKLSMFGFL